ncbi:myb-like protein X isoform X2 [Stegodyphus dumicola]|uniref:myb-like protein X isoform X2 n=1 Tax=Stegodyphus dumicola TaxID=202533 RepID=UPI0015AF7A73|nr:myb-like protein X isoform X2 [Stegodyphus dumicola]
MSRPPTGNRGPAKDMYWFAHGGIETNAEKCLSQQRSATPGEGDEESNDSNSPTWKSLPDRRNFPEEQKSAFLRDASHTVDGTNSGPSSLEREDRMRASEKRMAVEERKRQLWEAEQERNDALLKKHMEREAALEARRNAQRSNISFAFGSSVPRNVESLHSYQADSEKLNKSSVTSGLLSKEETNETYYESRSVSPFNSSGHSFLVDSISPQSNSSQICTSHFERKTMSPPCWLVGSGALIGDDIMSRSMTASVPAPRGRRKNDLMPTVPYDRTAAPRTSAASSTRKRSVSMTRLDQLAQPRKHYVEANKANSTASSGTSSMVKDNVRSPTRPLSSASEQSGGSGRAASAVNRRMRSSPRKPRPVSIAGSVPDHKQPPELKISPIKKANYTASKKVAQTGEVKKAAPSISKSPPKAIEKVKQSSLGSSAPKPGVTKATKQPSSKLASAKQAPVVKTSTPKVSSAKKSLTNKKKADILAPPSTGDVSEDKTNPLAKPTTSPPSSPPPDQDINAENEKNNAKRIISEEEAKAALAEKRRLAREQAEKEAELERQRLEQLKQEEDKRIRKEEEEQRKMEEEQIRLAEEHRRQEEEKLRKAIEEQERKEEEEKAKREEELRLKAEQDRKAKEEAEKQRIELEEKLRKEEEERAERKKRLEKIMSRTRGKASGTSPSGSVSSSDQLDSAENQNEGFSSGANSLESNEGGDLASESVSVDDNQTKIEQESVGNSTEVNPTYEVVSESESLNSNDLIMPSSETASLDNSLIIIPNKDNLVEAQFTVEQSYANDGHAIEISADATAIESAAEPTDLGLDTTVECTDLGLDMGKKSDCLLPEPEINSAVSAENLAEFKGTAKNTADEHLSNLDDVENEKVFENQQVLESHEYISSSNDFLQEPVTEAIVDQSYSVTESASSDVQGLKTDLAEPTEVVPTYAGISKEAVDNIDANEAFGLDAEQYDDNAIKENEISNTNVALCDDDDAVESNTLPTELLLPNPSISDIDPEEAISDGNPHYSISSDMKLPDPIYETSDEGSVSFDKQQQEYSPYMLDQTSAYNTEVAGVSDDVFSEQDITLVSSAVPKQPDEEINFGSSESFQKQLLNYENQFQTDINETKRVAQDDMYDYETSSVLQSALEQPREIGEENVVPSKSSTSSFSAVEHDTQAEVKYQNDFDVNNEADKENRNDILHFPSSQQNPFRNNEDNPVDPFDIYSEKENIQFSTPESERFTNEVAVDLNQMHGLGVNEINTQFTENNPFSTNQSEFTFSESKVYSDIIDNKQQIISGSEQISDFNNQNITSESSDFADITVIKAEGSEDCIGIISSVDHDQISNDFMKQSLHNEQLSSNFEYASITDSEDSSLDSNLSQVMTVEDNKKESIEGLNHVENFPESKSVTSISNTVEQEQSFIIEHTFNGDSLSKSNGSHLGPSVISNGHRMESSEQFPEEISEFHDYIQLDGKDISTVDHSKSNIFENVDAIDFSKVSPDPFLAKGNSNQISGNPFLMQDDQKQVLMTPDFFN